MPGAAIIATIFNTAATRKWTLNVAGNDLLNPLSSTQVQLDSIQVVESGPGSVSQMTFTIADPTSSGVYPQPSDDVRFWDVTNNRPNFTGFVQATGIRPWGAVGRYIDVTCVGIEVVLDWMTVSMTIPAGSTQADAMQSVLANASGISVQLRPFNGPGFYSMQDIPMAGANFGSTLQFPIVLAGNSVRDAFNQINASQTQPGFDVFFWSSIDFYGGVRVMAYTPYGPAGAFITGDFYADADLMTVDISLAGSAGAYAPDAGLNYGLDATGVVRGVYITGTNALASGFVSDGSGIPGLFAAIADSNSTTVDIRNQIGLNYLAQLSPPTRGTFSYSPIHPANLTGHNYRAGGNVAFKADGRIFIGDVYNADPHFGIASITKRWQVSGYENWTIAFGGLAPSAMNQMRRVTRSTRS